MQRRARAGRHARAAALFGGSLRGRRPLLLAAGLRVSAHLPFEPETWRPLGPAEPADPAPEPAAPEP